MILLQLILVVLFATTGVFQPPPERPPSGTVRYQLAANNLQGGSTISGETIYFNCNWGILCVSLQCLTF